MTLSTTHGWLACRKCFNECAAAANADWRLVHNPGYWGASHPSTLILGFSKGQTQNSAAVSEKFEEVAFAGMRQRLAAALLAVGILSPEDASNPDALFQSQRSNLGFASLIRCSLLMRNGDAWVGSGSIMPAAAKSRWAGAIICNYIQEHLMPLPSGVSRVVLLGTTPKYVASVTSTIASLFDDFVQINPMAFKAGGAVWAFVSHPSRANGHFNDWLSADAGTPLGLKREWARDALDSTTSAACPSAHSSIPLTKPLQSSTKTEAKENNSMANLLHPNPEPRSRLIEQAEQYLDRRFELINSTAKVAGFKLPSGENFC